MLEIETTNYCYGNDKNDRDDDELDGSSDETHGVWEVVICVCKLQ